MNNPFLKRLMKDKKEDIMHSSVYAKAQSAGVMGATSTTGFTERLGIDNNRQMVSKYHDSGVVSRVYRKTPGESVVEKRGTMISVDGSNSRMAASRVAEERPSTGGGVRRSSFEAARRPGMPPTRKNPGISR